MADIRTTKVSLVAPSAAGAISLTTGSSWASGTYGELLAATAATAWLLQVILSGQSSAIDTYEVDIAKGGAGSEVVIATVPWNSVSASSIGGMWNFVLPSPISGIGSSTRLAARIRNSGVAHQQSIAVLYIEQSDANNNTLSALSVIPSAANNVSVTPANSGYANSNYTELQAAAGAHELQAAALGFSAGIGVADYEFELATGGAGTETPITVIRGSNFTSISREQQQVIALAKNYAIPKNTRVAVRMRKSGTDVTAWGFKLAYYTDNVLAPGNSGGHGQKGGHGKGGLSGQQLFGPNLFVRLDTITGYGGG